MDKKTTSRFIDRPRTGGAWWTMILGLSSLLIVPVLGVLASLIRPVLDPASVNPYNTFPGAGFASCVFSLIIAVSALVTGIRTVGNGEWSWVVWVGMLAAFLVVLFWVFMIIGEFLFPH